MSQLSQNVPIHYFKMSQLPPEGRFACRIKFSWRIIPLTKIRIVRDDWFYAKLCEKCYNNFTMRKCAWNAKLCIKLQKMINCAIPHPPRLNVAPGWRRVTLFLYVILYHVRHCFVYLLLDIMTGSLSTKLSSARYRVLRGFITAEIMWTQMQEIAMLSYDKLLRPSPLNFCVFSGMSPVHAKLSDVIKVF